MGLPRPRQTPSQLCYRSSPSFPYLYGKVYAPRFCGSSFAGIPKRTSCCLGRLQVLVTWSMEPPFPSFLPLFPGTSHTAPCTKQQACLEAFAHAVSPLSPAAALPGVCVAVKLSGTLR